MTSINHQTRITNTLHAGILQTRQTPSTRAAPDQRREAVVDGLRLGRVVVVRLDPKGTAGEGASEEFGGGAGWEACAGDGLGDDGAGAGGLAPDGDGVGIAAKGGYVFVCP